MRTRGATVLAGVLAALMLLTGCDDSPSLSAPDLKSHVEVDSPALREAKKEAGVAPCPRLDGPGSELPDLTLKCLGGGRSVNLQDVAGPAVVSLWASWCTSCPRELPLYERLHREAGDRLTVLGVDYQDTQPGAALTLLRQTRAAFWQLADPGGDLADHFRLSGLPGILLVDGSGKVTFQLRLIDSYDELAGLVADHTGVDVRAG